MILKSGRKFILDNGFNKDSIVEILLMQNDNLVNEKETLDKENNCITLNKRYETEDAFNNAENESGFFVQPQLDEDKLAFDIKIKYISNDLILNYISSIGIVTKDGNNNNIDFARVTFPPVYKKASTEFKLTYTLNF